MTVRDNERTSVHNCILYTTVALIRQISCASGSSVKVLPASTVEPDLRMHSEKACDMAPLYRPSSVTTSCESALSKQADHITWRQSASYCTSETDSLLRPRCASFFQGCGSAQVLRYRQCPNHPHHRHTRPCQDMEGNDSENEPQDLVRYINQDEDKSYETYPSLHQTQGQAGGQADYLSIEINQTKSDNVMKRTLLKIGLRIIWKICTEVKQLHVYN